MTITMLEDRDDTTMEHWAGLSDPDDGTETEALEPFDPHIWGMGKF